MTYGREIKYAKATHEIPSGLGGVLSVKILEKAKPVALFKPKSERERQEVIASIWGLEGKTHETKIFTARRD